MDDYTDEEIMKAAGVRRGVMGRAAEGTFMVMLAALLVGGVIVAKIATFLGAVGLVLKFFGASFMDPWSWGTLVLMLAASTIAWLVISLFADT